MTLSKLTFVFLVLPSLLFAQDLEKIDIELEESMEEEFQEEDLQILNKIQTLTKRNKLDQGVVSEDADPIPDPWSPNKVRVALKKGEIIYDLEDKKAYRINRKIIVWARLKEISSQITYIYDKSGEIKYKALTRDLNFIEEDLKLSRGKYDNITYTHQTKESSRDKLLRFETDFNYQLESLNGNYYEQLMVSDGDYRVRSNSFNLRSVYKTSFDLDFGLELSFQNGDYEDDSQRMAWESWSLGPLFKYTLSDSSDFTWVYSFSLIKSLSHTAKADPLEITFSSYRLRSSLGLRSKYESFDLLFGIGFINEWISVKEINGNRSLESDREQNNGIFFNFGLGFDYII